MSKPRCTPESQETLEQVNDLPRYVRSRTFRELLDLSERAFRRGLAAGRIPPPDLRWGRSLRWRVSTVRAFLESLETAQGHHGIAH